MNILMERLTRRGRILSASRDYMLYTFNNKSNDGLSYSVVILSPTHVVSLVTRLYVGDLQLRAVTVGRKLVATSRRQSAVALGPRQTR